MILDPCRRVRAAGGSAWNVVKQRSRAARSIPVRARVGCVVMTGVVA